MNPARLVIPLRCAAAGASLGLLAGFGEAAFLATTPLPPVFFEPDTSFAIWFVAPLVGVCALGLLGFAVGLAGVSVSRIHPLAFVWLASAGGGAAFVYLGAVLGWLHARGEGLLRALIQGESGIWFLAGFLGTFVALRCGWRWVERFLDAEAPWPLVAVASFVGVTVAAAMVGLVGYRRIYSGFWNPKPVANSTYSHLSPDIVLISLDTVRADHLSTYGYSRPTTPNIDRLARGGVLFENAFAPSSWTLASHASIFTGLLPHQHGANQATPLYPGPWPLARILSSKGYETAGFSANLSYGFAGWGMREGFETYEDDSVSLRHNLQKTKVGRRIIQPVYERLVHVDDFDRRSARELNRDVRRWFRRRSGRPYFLFINYYDAHLSYFAPPPFEHHFGRISETLMREAFLTENGRLSKPFPSEEVEAHIAGYDNCLVSLDNEVGELMRTLATAPDGANTVVIITSDHGEAFGEHGLYGHGYDLHREVLHVPLIIIGPGIPSNRRIAHIAGILEIFPTVLETALGPSEPLARASLSRFWTPTSAPDTFDEVVISELVAATPDFQPASVSLMTSDWHYIHDSRGPARLYRWSLDPQEQRNLAGAPEHGGTLRDLHNLLLSYLGSSFPPWRGPEYLFGLDGPGYAFLRVGALGLRLPSGQSMVPRRIGASQALFTPDSTRPRRLPPMDEELIKSLPYH